MVIIISLSCLLLVVTYYILQVLEPLFLLFSSICFITILGCLLLIYQLDFFAFFLMIIYLGGVLIFLLFIILFLRQGFKPQLLPLNQAIMNYNFLILLILFILFVIYNQIFFIEPFIQIKTNLWLVCYIKITYLFTIIYSTIYDLYSSLLIVEWRVNTTSWLTKSIDLTFLASKFWEFVSKLSLFNTLIYNWDNFVLIFLMIYLQSNFHETILCILQFKFLLICIFHYLWYLVISLLTTWFLIVIDVVSLIKIMFCFIVKIVLKPWEDETLVSILMTNMQYLWTNSNNLKIISLLLYTNFWVMLSYIGLALILGIIGSKVYLKKN